MLCKGLRSLITGADAVWAEAGERFFQGGMNACWVWLAENGHLPLLRLYGKDVWETTLEKGLRLAATRGHADVVRFIREPLMEASMQLIIDVSRLGHLNVLRELLTFPRRGTRLRDAVNVASRAGHTSVVEALLEDVRYDGYHCKIALVEFVILGEDLGLQRLSMIALRENQHLALDYALSTAVLKGKASAVEILLGNGARFRPSRNFRDIRSAVMSGQPAIMRRLLDAGVPPAPHFNTICAMLRRGEFVLDVAIQFLDLLLTDSSPAGWRALALREAEDLGLSALADHIQARW